MATALLWADLDRQQTAQLSGVQPWTFENVSRCLCSYLEMDASNPKDEILLKYYFGNLRFTVENRFTAEKTSTLFSIMKLVHFLSMERTLTAEQSTQELRTLLLQHAVERPPYSIGIFSNKDVAQIMDHATDTYYRHYKLYRYVFTKKRLMDFSIKGDSVEVAPAFKPLHEATAAEDVKEPDIAEVAKEEPRELTEEEQVEAEIAADEELLNNPSTEMVQKLVAKRLESVKEQVEAQFKEQEEAYQARIAELEAKAAGQ